MGNCPRILLTNIMNSPMIINTNYLRFGKQNNNSILICPQSGCESTYIAKVLHVPDTGFGPSQKEAVLNIARMLRETADEIEVAVGCCYN